MRRKGEIEGGGGSTEVGGERKGKEARSVGGEGGGEIVTAC